MAHRHTRAPHLPADPANEVTAAQRTTLRDEDIVTERSPGLFRHLPTVAQGCTRHLLHQSRVGRVELCTGGTASLVVGGLTLRLPVGGLVELHELLHDALTHLADAEHRARAAALRGEDN